MSVSIRVPSHAQTERAWRRSDSRLVKDHNAGRVNLPRVDRAARRHSKPERDVVHRVHDDPLVLGDVLRRLADVGLDDVVAVQERHLAVRLDPHLSRDGNVQAAEEAGKGGGRGERARRPFGEEGEPSGRFAVAKGPGSRNWRWAGARETVWADVRWFGGVPLRRYWRKRGRVGSRRECKCEYECMTAGAGWRREREGGGNGTELGQLSLTSVGRLHVLTTHLVLRPPSEHIQRRDMQPEFFRLAKLSQAHAERDEVCARDRDGVPDEGFADVVDARSVEAEDVGLCARQQ